MLTFFKKIVSKLLNVFIILFHTPIKIKKLTHLFLFLFSLLLSIIFWCFVAYDSDVKAVKTLTLPIRYVGLAPGLDKKVSADVARVKISGKEKSLLNFSTNNLEAVVDLKGAAPGTHIKDIKVTSSANGVTVSNFYPSHSEVVIYRVIKRTLPVNINFVDNIGDKNISEVVLTPPQIVISGREEAVKSISDINVLLNTKKLDEKNNVTLPIIIEGIAEELLNDKELKFSQKNVVAHVVFEDEIVSKELPFKFTIVGHPQNNLVITKAVLLPSTVMVRAKASLFKHVKEINLGNVDIANVRGTTSMAIPFVVPKELRDPQFGVEFDAPKALHLNLICKETVIKKIYTDVPIKLVGMDEREWSFSTKNATVSVEANISTFTNNLNDELPFEVFVDGTDVVRDRITLPVTFKSKKRGVKLIGVEPSIVTITRK